jgi:hypothetical protein
MLTIDDAIVLGKDNGYWSVVAEIWREVQHPCFPALISVFWAFAQRFILNVLHFEYLKKV